MSPELSLDSAERELRRQLGGHVQLKLKQKDVLRQLAEGRSVFAGLPTGYGKSLCFWLPAAAWGWRVLVISPLISLLEDQTRAMEALDLRVIGFHGGLGVSEARSMDALLRGEWDIVFLTPERLVRWQENGVLTLLEERGFTPELLAFDEMHCLEEWKEFRPRLTQVFPAIRRLVSRGARFLGLSASFTSRERQLWMQEFTETFSVVDSRLSRENLSLFVFPLEDGRMRWLMLLASLRELQAPSSVLVYCASREECDRVSAWLRAAGIDATAYHAGLPTELRKSRTRAFREGMLRVVCATSAFGMGIDYPHVDRVIHFSLPFSLESYWQEAGRAGRSGQAAYSLVLWRRSEISRLRTLTPRARQLYGSLWRAFLGDACRMLAIAENLGLEGARCGNCDRCRLDGAGLPDWLKDCRGVQTSPPWWLQPSADPEKWLHENIFLVSKNS